MFLGRRLVMHGEMDVNYSNDLALGGIPRASLEQIGEWVEHVVRESSELSALKSVAAKGDKLYLKTRGAKSGEVFRRAKALVQEEGWKLVNPLLGKLTRCI